MIDFFKNFPSTPGLRATFELSVLEAKRLGHLSIGPEHLLLAILRKGDSLGLQMLDRFDVDISRLQTDVERRMKRGNPIFTKFLPITPSTAANRIIKGACHIAGLHKHGWVGTEHLLLALWKFPAGAAYASLQDLGFDFDAVQRAMNETIAGSAPTWAMPKVDDLE